ncbi:MAG TPA: hypothetical protein VIW64_17915 [Pyrinomonadaceae bacterium]
MEIVTVKISHKWITFARSPLSLLLTAMTAVGLAFVPLILFTLGRQGASFSDPRVIACIVTIFLVPLVSLRLAAIVIDQIRGEGQSGKPGSASKPLGRITFWLLLIVSAAVVYLISKP